MPDSVEATQSPDLSPCQQLLLKPKLEVKEANHQQLKGNSLLFISALKTAVVYWWAPVNEGVLLKTGSDGILCGLYFNCHHFVSICTPRATVLIPVTRVVSPGNLHPGSFPSFHFHSAVGWYPLLCLYVHSYVHSWCKYRIGDMNVQMNRYLWDARQNTPVVFKFTFPS